MSSEISLQEREKLKGIGIDQETKMKTLMEVAFEYVQDKPRRRVALEQVQDKTHSEVTFDKFSHRKVNSEVTFEHITDNYCYGAYGPFKVVIRKDNGYINTTKLCSSGGKDFYHWIENKYNQDLINGFDNYNVKSCNKKSSMIEDCSPGIPGERFSPSSTAFQYPSAAIPVEAPSCIFIKRGNITPIQQA